MRRTDDLQRRILGGRRYRSGGRATLAAAVLLAILLLAGVARIFIVTSLTGMEELQEWLYRMSLLVYLFLSSRIVFPLWELRIASLLNKNS